MISLLADSLISGDTVVTLLKTLFIGLGSAGAAWIVAFNKGQKKEKDRATNNITLQSPMPEVPVKRVYSPPTFSQHMAIVERVGKLEVKTEDLSKEIQEVGTDIRAASAKQYVEILNAGHERELRIIDKLDGIARGFHERVDDLLKANPANKKP